MYFYLNTQPFPIYNMWSKNRPQDKTKYQIKWAWLIRALLPTQKRDDFSLLLIVFIFRLFMWLLMMCLILDMLVIPVPISILRNVSYVQLKFYEVRGFITTNYSNYLRNSPNNKWKFFMTLTVYTALSRSGILSLIQRWGLNVFQHLEHFITNRISLCKWCWML